MKYIAYRLGELDFALQQHIQNGANVHRVANIRMIIQELLTVTEDRQEFMEVWKIDDSDGKLHDDSSFGSARWVYFRERV